LECGESRRFGFFFFALRLAGKKKEKSKAAILAALQKKISSHGRGCSPVEEIVGVGNVRGPSYSAGLTLTVVLGEAAGSLFGAGLPWMASKTSWRCTGTSLGATIPSLTLSPRISTTVTVMSLLMTMLSFFFLDSTNIAAYPSWSKSLVPIL
jgi:hypothetical protein